MTVTVDSRILSWIWRRSPIRQRRQAQTLISVGSNPTAVTMTMIGLDSLKKHRTVIENSYCAMMFRDDDETILVDYFDVNEHNCLPCESSVYIWKSALGGRAVFGLLPRCWIVGLP